MSAAFFWVPIASMARGAGFCCYFFFLLSSAPSKQLPELHTVIIGQAQSSRELKRMPWQH